MKHPSYVDQKRKAAEDNDAEPESMEEFARRDREARLPKIQRDDAKLRRIKELSGGK
jgi:hypothetical protein